MLFAAARSDHVERLIRPALAEGKWVICDRYLDSSRAYQGGGGGLDDADLRKLHEIGSMGLLPDLTVLVTVSPEVAQGRLLARDGNASDRIGSRSAEYHARVARSFADFAAQEPERFVLVDGDGTPNDTHTQVMHAIGRWL